MSHVYPSINEVIFLNAVKRPKCPFVSGSHWEVSDTHLLHKNYFLVSKFQKSGRDSTLKFLGWRRLKSNQKCRILTCSGAVDPSVAYVPLKEQCIFTTILRLKSHLAGTAFLYKKMAQKEPFCFNPGHFTKYRKLRCRMLLSGCFGHPQLGYLSDTNSQLCPSSKPQNGV